MNVILETNRLILREFTIEDLPRMIEIGTNPIVMRQFPPELKTPERAKKVLDDVIEQYKDKGYSLYAVIYKADNKLIGFCGFLYNYTDDGKEFIELSYRLDNSYWNQGLATEAAIACRDFAFNKLNFEEFYSIIMDDNYASLAIARKLGLLEIDKVDAHGSRCLLFKITNKTI